MQEYIFSEIKKGLRHSFEKILTEDKMQKFYEISGDSNPMHLDSVYARSNGMRNKVVFGMLSSSFYSTLVGVYLPGKYALLHQINLQFSNPVFVGDKLTISGEVTAIHENFRQIEVKAQILNQNLEKISRAKIKIGILK